VTDFDGDVTGKKWEHSFKGVWLYVFCERQQINSGKVGSTVKCIFIGYLSIQNGYVCYSSVERRLFVDVDMTFRENES
jgi:hypothetical protein